ncbi:arsenic resistance protein [Micrococcus luteus]|uniref:arsenic resistance protein n=1 Tax=unclassified Micrococcus TaxID=2620948 RepID=UPI001FF72F9F|nr:MULTISPECIES: arsenic resistance protein [unclassified Micrococcus]MCK1800951.1 arsenic resistance protein [Micrococcus sp. XM4230B]MCK1811213.1 arsenic resistance protein [Micrococcus sp. XM4230A]MCV7548416.1 arsenic resistance protein [Micrococcus luteus]MCV7686258.1 arsenic resistance protein [Micrococcus luteus]
MPSAPPRLALAAALERHQVALYLAGIAAGAVVGWAVPGAGAWTVLVEPVLALLLLATFLVVPAVVFGLSRFVAHDDALLVGVLLVLLAPCVDYVIVFTALAGGAAERLLAAAPLLMLVQLAVLPVLLRAFAGPETVAAVDAGPFVRALVLLILLPLAVAALVQRTARRGAVRGGRGGARVRGGDGPAHGRHAVHSGRLTDPRGGGAAAPLAAVVPLFAAFAAVMVGPGVVAARWTRLDVPAGRALVFSGVTRNSLVMLPLALSLPASLDPAPLVVVTQTLVEIGAMVSLVRLMPRLLPLHGQSAGAGARRTVT